MSKEEIVPHGDIRDLPYLYRVVWMEESEDLGEEPQPHWGRGSKWEKSWQV